MSLAIAGMEWVTPLGTGIDFVWQRLLQGEEASATTISEQFTDRPYSVFRVPASALKGISQPRLQDYTASATTSSEEFTDRPYSGVRAPESALKGISRPRPPRASAISGF